jgi:Tol biopolymer transport system component
MPLGSSRFRPSSFSRPALVVGLLLLGLSALIWAPASAHATVAYNAYDDTTTVWVSKSDDGAEAVRVGNGWVGQVSPDGKLLAWEHEEAFVGWELLIYNVETGKSWVRLTHLHTTSENIVGEVTALAWSPDSSKLAALGNDRGAGTQTLYVMNARGRPEKTRIATGHFRGAGFSPDGKQIVFGLAHAEGPLPRTDIARAPVAGGRVTLLTHDGVSGWPLWGPHGQIAFSKRTRSERFRSYGELRATEHLDLFTMKANGARVKRLTTGGSLEAGFFPAFWLPSGDRLVANFESPSLNYAAVVAPGKGTLRPIDQPIDGSHRGVGEVGFIAASLSPDESTVLGCFGSVLFALPPLATVPLAGGEPTVPNEDFFSPSWSGPSTAGAGLC